LAFKFSKLRYSFTHLINLGSVPWGSVSAFSRRSSYMSSRSGDRARADKKTKRLRVRRAQIAAIRRAAGPEKASAPSPAEIRPEAK
jgi:hypothetical protein